MDDEQGYHLWTPLDPQIRSNDDLLVDRYFTNSDGLAVQQGKRHVRPPDGKAPRFAQRAKSGGVDATATYPGSEEVFGMLLWGCQTTGYSEQIMMNQREND